MTPTTAPVKGQATQHAHKVQAVKRTVSVVILGLVLVNGIIAVFVETFDVYLGEVHLGWIAAASGLIAAIVTFLQRLLLVDGWLPFLEKIGLGTGVEKETPTEQPTPVPSDVDKAFDTETPSETPGPNTTP